MHKPLYNSLSSAPASRDRARRYIVIDVKANLIVATCGGTHRSMTSICERLDRTHRGRTFVYDDASEAGRYEPQVGPNIRLY